MLREEVVARALHEWPGPRPYIFTKCGKIRNGQASVDYSLRHARYGHSPGETAIAWTLRHPAVTGAIVGARNLDGIIGAIDSGIGRRKSLK
jgi:predicted oxidoreductase